MKPKHFFLLISLSTIVIVFNNCRKEGPQGPQGPAGEVNVKSYTFQATNWQYSSSQWLQSFSIPELTPESIDSAAVLVYFKEQTSWNALPFTEVASTNYFMGFKYVVNAVTINWTYNGVFSGDDPTTYYGTTLTYKVVIIPDQARKANPDIDWTNYEEVKTRFDLKD